MAHKFIKELIALELEFKSITLIEVEGNQLVIDVLAAIKSNVIIQKANLELKSPENI